MTGERNKVAIMSAENRAHTNTSEKTVSDRKQRKEQQKCIIIGRQTSHERQRERETRERDAQQQASASRRRH